VAARHQFQNTTLQTHTHLTLTFDILPKRHTIVMPAINITSSLAMPLPSLISSAKAFSPRIALLSLSTDLTSSVALSTALSTSTLVPPLVDSGSNSTWDTATTIGVVFAILAVSVGIPGALLATKKLRSLRRANTSNKVKGMNQVQDESDGGGNTGGSAVESANGASIDPNNTLSTQSGVDVETTQALGENLGEHQSSGMPDIQPPSSRDGGYKLSDMGGSLPSSSPSPGATSATKLEK
jgi:hypothetical protein